MFKIISVAAGLAMLAVLILAALKPDTFRVERKVLIQASPEKIFPYLEDVRKQGEWSPWEKKDPAVKKTYSGPAKGVGAVYEWDGNRELGAGRLEITAVDFPKKVVMDLHFLRPRDDRSVAAYAVEPKGAASEVTWSIEGRFTFPSKVACLFMNMDKMIGTEFEAGLSNLKTLAEKK